MWSCLRMDRTSGFYGGNLENPGNGNNKNKPCSTTTIVLRRIITTLVTSCTNMIIPILADNGD